NGMSIEIRKKEKLMQLEQWAYVSTHPFKRLNSFCYDDEDYTIAVTPILSIEEPDNSLSMGDEHLDTIPATESDEVIKSNLENLIPIPSESEGIPDHRCDVPFHDNSPPPNVSKDQFEDFSESNDEFSSPDDDSFSIDKIDYVEASPPDFELVSSEVMEIVIPEASPPDSELVNSKVMEIVIPKVRGIKASNDNPIPFYDPSISRTSPNLTPSGERGIKASTDNPIPSYDPIIPGIPPNLTPSGESDFFLEVDAFLAVVDESTSSQIPKSDLDPEGDMLLFEAFLNDDPSSDSQTKSSSTSLNFLLEETNNFHNSLHECTTFSNVLCDAECESDSSDDQCSRENRFETLSEEEIIPMESLRTHDSSLPISSKIDSLLEEFAGELTLLKSIPPGIDEADCDFTKDIRLIEKLLYDNSSPRPPKEFVSINSEAATESFSPSPILIDSLFDEFAGELTLLKSILPGIDETDCHPEKEIRLAKRLLYDNSSPRPPEEIVSDNSNVDIESFSPYPILNEDSASHMEAIDLFLNSDDPMPPGIEDDDYDS
nr:hypothetical protein [Tanacetum cinerariifolium]